MMHEGPMCVQEESIVGHIFFPDRPRRSRSELSPTSVRTVRVLPWRVDQPLGHLTNSTQHPTLGDVDSVECHAQRFRDVFRAFAVEYDAAEDDEIRTVMELVFYELHDATKDVLVMFGS